MADFNYGAWTYFWVVLVGVTFFFFSEFGLPGADRYLALFFIGVVALVFGFLFFKDDMVNNYLPFNKNFDRQTLSYVVGLVLVPMLILFAVFATPLNFNPLVFAPLASSSDDGIVAFEAFKLKASPLTQWFTLTKGASIFEEVLNVTFVVAGALVMVLLLTVFFSIARASKNPLSVLNEVKDQKKIIFLGALLFSVVMFGMIHVFNGTYVDNPILFWYAMAFRLVMNILIYTAPIMGFAFGVGVHEAWNNMALGVPGIVNAIFTPIGFLLIILTWVIPIVLVFARWKHMKQYALEMLTFRGSLQ